MESESPEQAPELPPDLQAGVDALQQGQFEAAVERLRSTAARAQAEAATGLEAAACGALAEAFLGLGRWAEAREAALRAHACAVSMGDRSAADDFAGMVATANGLQVLYPRGGAVDFSAAQRMEAHIAQYRAAQASHHEIAHLEAAVAAAEEGRLMGQEAGLLGGLASVLARQGRIDDARRALLRARDIVEVLGQERALAHFSAQLAALG